MNKRIIFRILGALGSALIIVSLFVPFIKLTTFSQSLWQSLQIIETEYIAYMLIAFVAISVLVFAIGIKTEFSLLIVGAGTFFIIPEAVQIIEQKSFGMLSIGFYCFVIGIIITLVMEILTNLKDKKIDTNSNNSDSVQSNESNIINKIDNLYNTNNQQVQTAPIEQVSSVSPIQVTPVEPIATVKADESSTIPDALPVQSQTDFNPTAVEVESQEQQLSPTISDNVPVQEIPAQPNPVVNEFAPVQPNPVVNEFAPAQPNPVVNEFAPAQPNPVVNEFATPNMIQNDFGSSQPLNNIDSTNTDNKSASAGLDIFGQ